MKKPTNPPKCPECNGSGVCRMCNGKGQGSRALGWLGTCPKCYGSGICITCQAPAVEVKK